jgi:hypothetical protein
VLPASGFRSSTGGQEGVPTKTIADARAIESDARMCHTKLTLPGSRQRIRPLLNRFEFGSHGVYPKSLENRVSHKEVDYELAEVDPGVPIRLCASAYHMAASRPSWPGVRMLHRLRTRVTVFRGTNENRHQTGTSTRPHPNRWDEHRSVRRSANLRLSRTRSGVLILV